jgi:cytoskeleton protein RodZ
VFEIGSSLREARERRGLELHEVEQATRIRVKYLQALEDERFDVIPGAAYAKGFLRVYADYLGLEPQPFVDQYATRFAPVEAPQTAIPVRVRRPRRWLDARLVAIPVAASLALFIWRAESGGGTRHHHAVLTPPVRHVRASTVTRTHPPARPRRPKPAARLSLVAARGPCWLSVRLGSETGKVLYERTLEQGETARFAGRRIWIRLGAPWNVDATLNGRHASLPGSIGNIVVTPTRLVPG